MNQVTNFYVDFLGNPVNAVLLVLLALVIMWVAFFKTKSVMFQASSFFTFVGSIIFIAMINLTADEPEIIHGPMVIIENGKKITPEK